jgi:2OG-Fe(II) oxygenase superfamily
VSRVSADPPSFRLTRTGAEWRETDAAALRRTFDAQHCVRLPGFLEPALLAQIRRLVSTSTFADCVHGDLASELRMEPGVCTGLLYFLVNDPQLFRLVEVVSGCAAIGSFVGRVYRRYPNKDHHDSWHGDLADSRRLVGMSVNLSEAEYEGGTFEIRDVETERLIATLPNTGFGDAILFRLDHTLEHQVSALRGDRPKTAFAGWFFTGVPYEPLAARTRPA